jgi:hypothetical protein
MWIGYVIEFRLRGLEANGIVMRRLMMREGGHERRYPAL